MEWLVTFRSGMHSDEIRRVLAESGCAAGEVSPVPLGDSEQVVAAQGPADLPRRLESQDGVVKVYPNSSLTLY